MSKFFVVEVPKVYTSKMVVMADSVEEAVAKTEDREGLELSVKYSITLDADSFYSVWEGDTYEIEEGVTAADIGARVVCIGTSPKKYHWLLVDVKNGEARLYRTVNGCSEECSVLTPLVSVDSPPTPEYVAEAQRIMQGKEL